MRRLARCSAAAVLTAVVLALPVKGFAADYCIDVNSNTIVLKSFALPGKGKCKDALGFFLAGSTPWWLHGMACGSSDGARVTFNQIVNLPDLVESFAYTLDRTTLTGSLRQCVIDTGSGGGCVSGIAINKIDCSPAKVPVP